MASLCVPRDDGAAGAQWAQGQHAQLVHWPVTLSYKGEVMEVAAQPTDALAVVVESVADVLDVDPQFVKVILRGRRLDLAQTLSTQGVKSGAKLMLIASSPEEVARLLAQRSDPTVRGFDGEKRLEAHRRSGLDPVAASEWRAVQDKEHKFGKLEVVAFPCPPVTPHPFEAEKLLVKLSTDPGIVACMREHKWFVGKLCEMDPADDKLKKKQAAGSGGGGGGGACTLGYNENGGARIYVRLRTDDLRGMREYRGLVTTLLHELAHNEFGPHTRPFWCLFSDLRRLYLNTHAALQRSGTLVGGKSAAAAAGLGAAETADVMGSLEEELGSSATNGALQPHERAAAAVVLREQRLLAAALGSTASVGALTVGGAGGGADQSRPTSAREAAAAAAEKREAEKRASSDTGSDVEVPIVVASVAETVGAATVVIQAVVAGAGSNEETTGTKILAASGAAAASAPVADPVSTNMPAPLPAKRSKPHMTAGGAGATPSVDDEADATRVGAVPEAAAGAVAAVGTVVNAGVPPPAAGGFSGDPGDGAGALQGMGREATVRRHAEALAAASGVAAAGAASVVATVAGNLLAHPGEPKYRRLRRANKRFAATAGASQDALAILAALGFAGGDDEDLALPGSLAPDPGLLWLAKELLSASAAAPTAAPAVPSP